jgi:hypothetical protein
MATRATLKRAAKGGTPLPGNTESGPDCTGIDVGAFLQHLMPLAGMITGPGKAPLENPCFR